MCWTCMNEPWCPEHSKYMPGHRDGDGCQFPDAGHFNPRVRRVRGFGYDSAASPKTEGER